MTEKDALPLPPSRGQSREAMVGLFVILGVAAVLITLYTLTDAAMFRGRYFVRTLVPDAGGIRRGDPVQMRGVNIGRVQRVPHLAGGRRDPPRDRGRVSASPRTRTWS